MYATDIKASIVGWIIPHLDASDALGSEVAFSDQDRKADLVIVKPCNLVAIEIKGPRDDYRRLSAQLKSYQSMFLETYVAAHGHDVNRLKKHLPRGIGIIRVSETLTPEVVRIARHKQYLEKKSSLRWLNTTHLRTNKSETIELRRQKLMSQISKEKLTQMAISAAHAKIEARYRIFLSELGKNISIDDITLLSSPSKIMI